MTALNEWIAAMQAEFGDDQKRIGHALDVLDHARRIQEQEGGNRKVVLAAAVLHDIGIRIAERRHGSAAPKYQELEGPPVARRILAENGRLSAEEIEHVCRIVGSHHSAKDIDTLEFRMVWDADWLVNFPELYPAHSLNRAGLEERIDRIFRTPSGRRLARERFI